MEDLRVGVTAARRGQGLVAALERRGAVVDWAPTLAGDAAQGRRATEDLRALLTARPTWLVASTGVGVRTLSEVAAAQGLAEELVELLRGTRVVARGAKAHAALRLLGVAPVFVSPQETDGDTAAWLTGRVLPGDVVGVVVHGGADAQSYRSVAVAGCELLEVRPYRSTTTPNTAPVEQLIAKVCAGGLDAIVCTSPGSFRGLVDIASETGREANLLSALRERVAVAAIGPVTATTVEETGARVAVMPLRQRTADLVSALDAWSQRGPRHTAGLLTLHPREQRVDVDGASLRLGVREFNLAAALIRRPDVVCPPDTLAREVWGHSAPADPAAVKHLVSRVRRKLGRFSDTIETVRAVGYRYQPLS